MADVSDGATLTFGTSGTSLSIRTLQHTGIGRAAAPTSHLGTSGGKTYIPGDTYEPGEITGTFLSDPDVQPPYTAAAETITITYPIPAGGASGATMAASGFVTNFDDAALELDQEMVGSFTIKLSGNLTFTDSA